MTIISSWLCSEAAIYCYGLVEDVSERRETWRGRRCTQWAPTGQRPMLHPELQIVLEHWLQNFLHMPPPLSVSCCLSFIAVKSSFSFLEHCPWFWSEAAVVWLQQAIPVNNANINPGFPPNFCQRCGGQGAKWDNKFSVSQGRWAMGLQLAVLPNHLPDLFPNSCFDVDVCFDRRLMHMWTHNFLIYCRWELITLSFKLKLPPDGDLWHRFIDLQ